MKKGIIVDLGGQLGNQLWTYLSVWAYCREKNIACRQLAFYQYSHHFPGTRGHWFITPFFNLLNRIFPGKKSFIKNFLYHKLVLSLFLRGNRRRFLNARGFGEETLFLLPPTPNPDQGQMRKLHELEETDGPLYFNGPAFRNPVGAEKYHSEICEIFSPRRQVKKKVSDFICALRKKHDFLVGVHIRQADYRTFGDKFYFSPEKVASIIADFADTRPAGEKICFVIASDEPIDLEIFGSLPAVAASGGMIEDLFTLSLTDFIIGSNSTYSAFAAYYGNIPMAIFKVGPINWDLYARQKNFFFDPESIAHLGLNQKIPL